MKKRITRCLALLLAVVMVLSVMPAAMAEGTTQTATLVTDASTLKVGDEIDVYVISFDPEKHKISLGYKTDEMNPWNQFMSKYSVGDVVEAKIVKLMTFGAFAEILPGVDGLIHISQISDRRIGKPEDVLSEGQVVKVMITDIGENKRISLSIRALLEQNPEDAE